MAARDTGYHDHTGSGAAVHVIEGRARNEPLTIGEPPVTGAPERRKRRGRSVGPSAWPAQAA